MLWRAALAAIALGYFGIVPERVRSHDKASQIGTLSFAHIAQLKIEHDGLPKRAQKQENSGIGQYPSRYSEPPFVRRFLMALPLIPLSFGCALFGGYNLYRKRYGFGAALIGIAWFCICMGAGLIMLSYWPATWEWWV